MKVRKDIGTLPALLIAVLSFGGFMGVAAIVSQNGSHLIPVTLADDDEGDDGGGDGGGGGNDEDDDKDDDKDKKKSDADKKEKKQTERSSKVSDEEDDRDDEGDDDGDDNGNKGDDEGDDDGDDEGDDEGDDDGDDEGDDEGDDADELDDEAGDDDLDENDEDSGDDNTMYRDQDKTLSKLYEKLAEIEKDILEKQAEGVDVTAALARVASVKAVIGSVKGAFDVNNLDEVKRLAKEARKLTHFASEEDLHDAKEVAEDAAKVAKRITQAYGKVALLEAVGGNGGTFRSTLATLEADLAALKATIAAGSFDPETMSETLEALERRVKTVKSAAEGAVYALGGTDSKYDDEYEEESDDVFEHLNDVAEIEDDSVGRVIGNIAKEHRDAAKVVSDKVAAVDERNVILQTLFGPDGGDLRELEAEIAGNEARADMLLRAAGTIEDEDVKAILLDQIAVLREQAAKLETFVSGQRDRLSLFGWFFNLGK